MSIETLPPAASSKGNRPKQSGEDLEPSQLYDHYVGLCASAFIIRYGVPDNHYEFVAKHAHQLASALLTERHNRFPQAAIN